MARVVIGLSGGVDSSVAAYLLQQAGHEVIGLFMINWHDTTGTLEGDCPWHDDRLFAELVARRLDIPFHTVDLSDQYRRRVVDYMFSEYAKGRTPNPDVLCNREIKFDVFLKEALKLGADFVATGHYCRKAEETAPDGRTIYKLLAGSDPNKDQSYFLCQLSQEQLSRALFPVGHLLKPEVRRIAEQMKLATAKRKDSQGICFVGKVDLPVFLQQKLKAKTGNVHEIKADWPKYGQAVPLVGKTEDAGMGTAERTASDKSATLRGINPANTDSTECPNPATAPTATAAKRSSTPTDTELAALAAPYRYTVRDGKKIGQHNGAHFYTIGQRKGLGIGGRKESLFRTGNRRGAERDLRRRGRQPSGTLPPGLADRSRRAALDRPAPGIENGRKPSFRCPYPLPPAAARSGTLHPSGRGLPAFRRTSAWNHAGTVRSLVRWR